MCPATIAVLSLPFGRQRNRKYPSGHRHNAGMAEWNIRMRYARTRLFRRYSPLT
jgi:hypothetical protein